MTSAGASTANCPRIWGDYHRFLPENVEIASSFARGTQSLDRVPAILVKVP